MKSTFKDFLQEFTKTNESIYPSFEELNSKLKDTQHRLGISMRALDNEPYKQSNIKRLKHEIKALEDAIAGKKKEETNRKNLS